MSGPFDDNHFGYDDFVGSTWNEVIESDEDHNYDPGGITKPEDDDELCWDD